MGRLTAWAWRAYAIAAVVFVLDQLSKYWVLSVLRLPEGYAGDRPESSVQVAAEACTAGRARQNPPRTPHPPRNDDDSLENRTL